MPLKLSPEDRRLVVIAGVVFVVSALLALFFSPAESDADFATSYSTASQGAKAAYLLLRESGYRVERWSHPPAELRDAQNALLILADPLEPPQQIDKEALEKFLNDGGEVVLAGDYSQWFVSQPGPTHIPVDSSWQTFAALAPAVQTLQAPQVRMDTAAAWSKPASGVGLYGDAAQYVVMQFPEGKGSVLWLASASMLSNAGLREAGNLEFLLSTVGSKSRHVLWDEYFHGHRSETSVALAHPQVIWLFAQLSFLGVAMLITFSRRSGPRRAPRPESRLSPLEYVRALGQLYEHARAGNVAVDIAYERFRYTLGKRLGLRPMASSDELARTVAERSAIDREELRSLLEACESARFYEDLNQKEALALVQRLHRYSVMLKLSPQAVDEDH